MLAPNEDVVHLKDLDYDDKKLVGEELCALGELAYRNIDFIPSFVVTPHAFNDFKKESDLQVKINHLLGSLNQNNHASVTQVSSFIKNHVLKAPFPNDFIKKIFSEYEKIEKKNPKVNLTLTAYYFHKNSLLKKEEIRGVNGESVLLTKIRDLWSYIFRHKILTLNEMTHDNQHLYGISILIKQEVEPKITGYIRTVGEKHEKDHFVIEALENVKLTYNKRDKKIEDGKHIKSNWHNFVTTGDLKKLIRIGEVADKYLYYPHIIYWGKDKDIFVTSIKPVTHKIEYYSKLEKLKGIPLHPGIRIGRVRFIEKNHDVVMSNEEVVIVKSLTKPVLESIRRASAIITEDDLSEEIKFYLKQRGIPSVIKVKDAHKSFKNGEIITVDATNGSVRHGSILVSRN